MTSEESKILQAILQELQLIRQELQLLRQECKTTDCATPGMPEHDALIQGVHSVMQPFMAVTDIADTAIIESSINLYHVGSNPLVEVASADSLQDSSAMRAEEQIIRWLADHKITVKTYKQHSAADAIFDQVAIFLGERFDSVRKVHDQIRKTLSSGSSFKVNFSACTQEEIANSTQLCTILHEYAFLSSYRYHKNSKTISATPQRVGNVINFFSGGWFERFVFLKITSMLQEAQADYMFLLNPQISLPCGDDFELDLFFLVNNEPFWIECKTGDYQPHIVKYSNVRKTLAIPKERSILAILGISDQLTAQLSNVYSVMVGNENNFLTKAAEIVGCAQSGTAEPLSHQ